MSPPKSFFQMIGKANTRATMQKYFFGNKQSNEEYDKI
jgi:hypothetical protein